MNKIGQRLSWWVAVVALVVFGVAAPSAFGQGPFQRFTGMFAPKTPAPEPVRAESPHRLMEIQVELAWLADPTTFPYYLEARVESQAVEIRGYVPSRGVREQAVKLARLHCPLGVVDSMKELSNLAVRITPRPPEHLEKSIQAALREAFPKQYQNLFVKCQADGNVTVSGFVPSFEHKLSVSQALRRQHGCTSITNLTQVSGGDVALASGGRTNTAFGHSKSADGTIQMNERPGEPNVTVTASSSQPDKNPPQKKAGLLGLFSKAPANPPRKPAEPTPLDNQTGAPSNITRVSQSVPQPEAKPGTPPSGKGKSGDAYETRGMVIVDSNEPPMTDPKASTNPKTTWEPKTAVSTRPTTEPRVNTDPKATTDTKVPAPVVAVSQTKAGPAMNKTMIQPQPAARTPAVGLPTAAQVKKRLEIILPGNRDVQVTYTGDSRLRIELKARPGEEFSALAGQILSLQELEPFGERVDLQIQMPALEK